MKKYTRSLLMVLVVLMLSMLSFTSASAAKITPPGKVLNVKVKVTSETSATVSWSPVKGATGYTVYRLMNNKKVKMCDLKSTKVVLNKRVPLDVNKIQIFAFKKSGKQLVYSTQGSNVVSFRTPLNKPGKISGFHVLGYGNKAIVLQWNKATYTTEYNVYRYVQSRKEYVKLGTTTDLLFEVKNLVPGTKYYFKVEPVRKYNGKDIVGQITAPIAGTAKEVDLGNIHRRYWKANLINTVTVKTTKGISLTLQKGTLIATKGKVEKGNVAAIYNSHEFVIQGENLRYGNLAIANYNYTQAQKENFINYKAYRSRTNYLIWVSEFTCEVTVLKGSQGKWKQVMADSCVIGKEGATGMGKFRILEKSWKYGGPFVIYMWNKEEEIGNGFHKRVDAHTRGAYSHGCIRLGDGILNYINANCPLNTTVVIY